MSENRQPPVDQGLLQVSGRDPGAAGEDAASVLNSLGQDGRIGDQDAQRAPRPATRAPRC